MMAKRLKKPWNILADIGGTNARFAVQDCATGDFGLVASYSVDSFPEFDHALEHFLADVHDDGSWRPWPEKACFAVACAIEGDTLSFTNSPWSISRQRLSAALGHIDVALINDFVAVGQAIAGLGQSDYITLGGGTADHDKPIAVLGPGTGLGVCSVVNSGGHTKVVEGEGGRVDFAPVTDLEIQILQQLLPRFGHVSVERLLSGGGILNIYQALAAINETEVVCDSPEDVTSSALQGSDPLATQALQVFCEILGSVAGNLALTLGAKGGVYITGGIAPRIIDFIVQSDIRRRFEAKGRFDSYLAKIPLMVVCKPELGLQGAAHYLEAGRR